MSSLSHREKLLLERYRDGECGFLRRISAERLLERSEAAVDYLGSVESLATEVLSCWPERRIDLWNGIEARIKELQSSLAGETRIQTVGLFNRLSLECKAIVSSFKNSVATFSRFSQAQDAREGSLFGARSGLFGFATVLLALPIVFFAFESNSSLNKKIFGAQHFSGAAVSSASLRDSLAVLEPQKVALPDNFFDQEMLAYRPRDLLASGAQNDSSVRIDWVRGAGETRVLQGRNGSSAPVFWVSDRGGNQRSVTGEDVLEATPRKTIFLQAKRDREGLESSVSRSASSNGLASLPFSVLSPQVLGSQFGGSQHCNSFQSSPDCAALSLR
jgi:hypothetical protein